MATGTQERAGTHRNGVTPPQVTSEQGAALAKPPSGPLDMLRLGRALPALVVLAVAAALTVWGLRNPDIPAPPADVTQLPASLGTWHLLADEKTDPETYRLADEVQSSLSVNSYTQRAYEDSVTGRRLLLLLEYRTLNRGAFNHRPEQCYPSAGWSLPRATTTPITYGGKAAKAVTLLANKGSYHQVLLYFFASGPHAESSFWKQQFKMAFSRLQTNKNGWAFFELVSNNPPGEDKAALAAEKDFVQQASPSLIRLITTAKSQ